MSDTPVTCITRIVSAVLDVSTVSVVNSWSHSIPKTSHATMNIMIKKILNKKVGFNYVILDRYTAGLVLKSEDVKQVRFGRCNITSAHAGFANSRPVVYNLGIGQSVTRYLLLKKSEINRLIGLSKQTGVALIPLELHIAKYIKLIIGVCKGKKMHDKRAAIKDREQKQSLLQYKHKWQKQ